MVSRKVTAPKHLKPATKRWFNQVLVDYDLEPHHYRMLTIAADNWDIQCEARARLAAEGLTVPTRHGMKPHPCVKIAQDAGTLFLRAVRELDLDVQPPPDTRSYPPALQSNRR